MSGKGSSWVTRDEDGRIQIHIDTGDQVSENETKKEDRTATRVIRDGSGAMRIEIITEEYQKRLDKFSGFVGDTMFEEYSVWEKMALYQEYCTKSSEEYVVSGSIIGCQYGSNLTRIGISEDHGVYNRDKDAVLTCGDCKPAEHIHNFGVCRSPKALDKTYEIVTVPRTDSGDSGAVISGPKCAMVLSPQWVVGNVHTHIWNDGNGQYEKALIENGVLACMYGGGLITVRKVKESEDDAVRIKVTLEQLSGAGWSFRKVTGYDLDTSIPEYENANYGRPITQEDVDEINRVMDEYEINRSVERIRHFLAQCHAESEGGFLPIERYDKNPLTDLRFKNYEKLESLGNTPGSGDGYKYRGAGAIQITGKNQYKIFSEYMNDSQILTDGALYVGKNYYWETAGFFWSVYKPGSCINRIKDEPGIRWPVFRKEEWPTTSCIYDLNALCDSGASVWKITDIVYGDGDADDSASNLSKREKYYAFYKEIIK